MSDFDDFEDTIDAFDSTKMTLDIMAEKARTMEKRIFNGGAVSNSRTATQARDEQEGLENVRRLNAELTAENIRLQGDLSELATLRQTVKVLTAEVEKLRKRPPVVYEPSF